MEELDPTNICTYWPNNPAFDPKRVLLLRLFFISEDRTNYVSVGFYPARDYLPRVEFGVLRWAGGPKTLILGDDRWTHWRRPCPRYGETCVVGKPGVAGARVVPSGWM